MEGDDTRFVLTSRNPDGSLVRFQLQASSADTCRAWVNDVVQILESQRNFLNGRSKLGPPDLPVISAEMSLVGILFFLLNELCVCVSVSSVDIFMSQLKTHVFQK